MFPTISHRHGRLVREKLREQFPDRYQSMPLSRALAQLYNTGRVYRDDVTLIEPHTGNTARALHPAHPAA